MQNDSASEFLYKDETYEIIGICMDVHRHAWVMAFWKLFIKMRLN